MNLKNRRVLVVGFGVTGAPLVDFLHRKGAFITLNDAKNAEAFGETLQSLAQIPMKTIFGGHPADTAVYGETDLIIVSPGVPLDLPFLQSFKHQEVPLIGEIELAYQFMKAPVAAITGTNGKTTTTALTGEIFQLGGKAPEVIGNIGVPAISKAELLSSDHYFVMEISSFQLETIDTFRPAAAALLNITPDHLNRHGTMESYSALKYRIFENQGTDDVAVINADDPVCMAYKGLINARIMHFSRLNKIKEGIFTENDKMIMRWDDEEKTIIQVDQIKIPGAHNLENAMAAAGLAISAGVPVEAIQEGLMTFKGVAHRIEHVTQINGVDYVNDSKATNPDAAIKAIEAIEAPIILLAGGMNKKNDFTTFFEAFKGKVKHVYVYGETAEQLMETAHKTFFYHIDQVSDLEEAVQAASSKAVTGDTVLLSPACASWDMYNSFEERGNHFKELILKKRLSV
ncbi:MAG: UDP-N-acetylmuramoyl-L-alanine--D-glutamate ligase [Bacillota bacterium]|nr:UDP-N-acetylmuramoyl-L-alanine--D-glutamate ligase [Bacillota bacterium]MDW7676474.1 UDP-N-acetylmuramoyl-L-alanine--D-glutamate ligase [Bacillota bacterium]